MSRAEQAKAVTVGVDGSPHSDAAREWALRYADAHRLPVRLVTALEWPIRAHPLNPNPVACRAAGSRSDARRILGEAVRRSQACYPALHITGSICADPPVPALLAAASRSALIVVGRRGHHAVTAALVGSVPASVAGRTHCPVVVVGDDNFAVGDRPVVAGLDESTRDQPILRAAFEEATRYQAPLVAAHARTAVGLAGLLRVGAGSIQTQVDPRAAESTLVDRELDAWAARYPAVPVRTVITHDQPAATLIGLSQTARLVVVGSHGRGGLTGMLLGSVGRHVVRHAACPVMVVRSDA